MNLPEINSQILYHRLQIKKLEAEVAEHFGLLKLDGSRLSTIHIKSANEMLRLGISKTKVAELLGVSRVTLYRAIDDSFRLRNNKLSCVRMKKRRPKKVA